MGDQAKTTLIIQTDGQNLQIGGDAPLPVFPGMATETLQAALSGGIDAMAMGLGISLAAITETFRRVAASLAPAFRAIGGRLIELQKWETIFAAALEAAKVERPKWATIYNRTKKARIRKKYKNRILRWYEVNDHGPV